MAGAAASLFGLAAGISGYNVSEIESLLFVAQHSDIQIGGLLFAGILISSLGAVMDVGMSIASTLNEIHEKKPEMSSSELFFGDKRRTRYDGDNVQHVDTGVCGRFGNHADDKLRL